MSTQNQTKLQISKPNMSSSSPNQLTENPISDTPKNTDNNLPQQNIPTPKKTFAKTY